MKTLKTILAYALCATTIIACDNDNTTENEEVTLPKNISRDLASRYPDAKIDHFFLQKDQSDVTEITFTDKDGLSNEAHYKDEKWLSNRKSLSFETYSDFIPNKVQVALLQHGYSNTSNFNYVFEDSQISFKQKQYQFVFTDSYDSGMGELENDVYNLIIAEDGTVLSINHYQLCSPSIFPYDQRAFCQLAQDKYPNSKLIGSTYDGRNVIIFIKDENIVKNVTIYEDNGKMTWIKTWYSLDLNTTLPESVIADKNEYESQHPNASLASMCYEEDSTGSYYGLEYCQSKVGEIVYFKVK